MTEVNSKCIAARIPKRHRSADFDLIPDICPHKEHLEKWLRTLRTHVAAGDGLLLYGKHSTGKSASAAIIAKFAIAYGIEVLWVRHSELLGFRYGDEMFDDLYSMWDWCQSVKLLIVDEVFIPKAQTKAKTELETLLRWRVDYELSTILTMNQGSSDIEKNCDADGLAAIFDEVGKWWHIRGHDFRKEPVK